MGSTGDFPFDIEQVASLLPIKIRRPVANGVYTDCPFCGDDRGKLKINYENNTWRCNYCGEKGSRFFYCNEEGFYPVAFAAEKAKIKGFY